MDWHVSGKALNLIFPKFSSQNMRGFDHATILSSSSHGLCKERLAQWPAFCDPNSTKNCGGGGVLPEKLGGGVLHASRLTLTLFPGKTCDFPYPISDLIKKFDTLFQTWSPGSPARDRSAWQDVTTRTQLACEERKETLADKPLDFENRPLGQSCLSSRTDIWCCHQLS